ncbi:E3 ubiquitin-protein ligase rnf168 [Chelmon rostratus]|uniref:E3 ubiquitin-protein ligase rnf168 n=1 Tax=Chelmon rostratus TaxID=109905 RepID=UPI001BEB632F|nr:E3 ubiquitin-protein ligase rnf168 [Chelmon rostratus]XP_041797184.1 E3 ubiquitin-protein ligase rnf168 [Chelmon rostratus]XP_041797185.1 E3 ubiquitin-protein ligase rnf168 [Chelmon rostratus]
MAPVSNRGVLSLDECRCPVCLEIFMEPVTLPCTHTFCKGCFLESVDKATLCCPLCRKRVSTWARLNSRNNTLVNQQLWTQIQTSFPLQCQRRLSGQDVVAEDDPGVSVCFPRVSQPGELRQEYEDQVTKLTEEKRALDEEERRASEEYIQRLLAEEEELLQEDRRRREDDERLARLLSNQLNSAAVSQENPRSVALTPAKKKKEVGAGQIEKFLCPRLSKTSSPGCSSASSFTANKENILLSQVKLQDERPLPHLDYYGDRPEPPELHPSALSSSVEDLLHPGSHLTRDGGPSSTKRKSSELDVTEEEEETVTKRVWRSLPSSSSSSSTTTTSSSSLEVGGSVLQGIAEREMELLRRQQQEEEDRRLALLLQKELDQEEKQRATDRRKGSSDAYPLRQNYAGREPSSSDTPSRPSSKTTKTPTPSSASSVKTTKTPTPSSASSVKTTKTPTPSSSRGSKQATLTEMFSSLSR